MIEGYDPPKPNKHLLMKIAVVIGNSSMTKADEGGGRTKLDNHANICVLGRQYCILPQSGKSVDVGAFIESAGGLNQFPIIDAMLAYNLRGQVRYIY
jgi:hypothetical protein